MTWSSPTRTAHPYTPTPPPGTSPGDSHNCRLPRIRLHDLRHTWATLALESGIHPKVVQERLGHANVSITLDLYSHVSPAMQSDAAERVAALFVRPPATTADPAAPSDPVRPVTTS